MHRLHRHTDSNQLRHFSGEGRRGRGLHRENKEINPHNRSRQIKKAAHGQENGKAVVCILCVQAVRAELQEDKGQGVQRKR